MAFTSAYPVGLPTVPVIDLGPLRAGSDPRTVALQLHRAASEVGFFYAMNHAVPQRTIDAAVDAAMRFFALPTKRKLAVRANGRRWGFVERSAGGGESFRWGSELPRNGSRAAPAVRNSWPDRAVPQMRYALDRYHQAMVGCARDLLRGFALGLGLPEAIFLAKFHRPLARGEVIYNPPRSTAEASEQPEPRTDVSCLTLRWQDTNGGLQVMSRAGAWVAVPPIPGTLVVSVGELMARWTDELFVARPYRLVGINGGASVAAPVHVDPNADALVDAADILPEPRGPRRHPLVRARDRIVAHATAA